MNMRTFQFHYFQSADKPHMWIAECDELNTCTEGKTYEEMAKMVWDIGPTMAVELGLCTANEDVFIEFKSLMNGAESYVQAAE